MVLILNKDTSKKEIQEMDEILYNEKSPKGFDAKKYNGKVKLNEDALTIQKNLRDEWGCSHGSKLA